MRAPPNARNPVQVRLVRRIVSLFARCFEHRGRVEAAPLLREVVPAALNKAGDQMLFYCALCAAESRNGVAVRARKRDVPLEDPSATSITMTRSSPDRRLYYLSVCPGRLPGGARSSMKDLVKARMLGLQNVIVDKRVPLFEYLYEKNRILFLGYFFLCMGSRGLLQREKSCNTGKKRMEFL